jgi:RNA polymerase sigma factor (sigma-70 family)
LINHLRIASPEEASVYCEELIRRFEPLLRGAWRRVSFVVEYPDFVQDVFVRLFSRLPYLENVKAFPGYFRQIVLSAAVDHLRKWYPRQAEDSRVVEAIVSDIDEKIIAGIFVRSYLEHLTTRDREVLIMEFFEGKTPAEISQALGVTRHNVRTIKSRALKKLRAMIRADVLASEKELR